MLADIIYTAVAIIFLVLLTGAVSVAISWLHRAAGKSEDPGKSDHASHAQESSYTGSSDM
jgi:hypothetical protein